MAGKLKSLDLARLITPGKYPDGDGLYLIIAGPKSKSWSYRYWIHRKERWQGLGSYDDVSLREARVKRDVARQQVRAGIDVVHARRSRQGEVTPSTAVAAQITFEECADRFIDENWTNWSRNYRAQWPSSLKHYAYPKIGHLTIGEIKPSHIFELLEPIWVEKAVTANRVRGRIETVIARNVDLDDTDFRNPAALTKQLREKLPRRPRRVQRHHPSLSYSEAPSFWQELIGAPGTAAVALQLVILTAGRTNEVLGARWSEINVTEAVWRIPGGRMKMGEGHSVPLSSSALTVLNRIRYRSQSDLIFLNDDGNPFSGMAMLAVLKRMNYGHVTVHGFRATFATWAEDCTGYADGVREAALAHQYKGETTAAYQRGEKLEKRRLLMNDWARYICGGK
ncbi:integrase [Bradyrhizobium sp. USDA 4011]